MASNTEVITKSLNNDFLVNPIGLNNSGVICHFNSLLQMLLSCSSILETITELQPNNEEFDELFSDLTLSKSKPKLNKLLITYKQYNDATWSSQMITALVSVLRKTKQLNRFGSSQESASEGLVLLLDAMDNTAIYKLFLHRYSYTIKCDCGYILETSDKAVHFECFNDIKFNTSEEFARYLLKHESEVVDYVCDKCKLKQTITRVHKLKMLPEILILLFNKYTKKELIWYPTELLFPSKALTPLRYKLVGQIEHYGGLHGGHYTAFGLRKDNKFYHFNDSSVQECIPQCTPNTYLVAYNKI
jgi:ubiquitin C-terminal hydrolase